MRPNYAEKTLTVGGATEAAMFGISSGDESHIMSILRDTLYTDRILAVLREYGSNAWDAHRSVGKNDVPIKVTLPKLGSPTLSIRDFGPGLSREGVFKIYTQYGASSKRDSNEAVGMMGIGSKSAFAYSDSFTITSYHGGTKSIYSATLDSSNKGIVSLLYEGECGDETGIQIDIPVGSNHDLQHFESRAKGLFKYFNPLPDINLDNLGNIPGKLVRDIGSLHVEDGYYHEWVAVMGCIPYKISVDKLFDSNNAVPRFLTQCSGTLNFDIGEVQVSASREELRYSEETKRVVRQRVFDLMDAYVEDALEEIKKKSMSEWDTKVRKQDLYKLGFLTSEAGGTGYISIPDNMPFGIYLYRTKSSVRSIRITDSTVLIVKDDDRLLSGFTWDKNQHYMMRPSKGKKVITKEQVQSFLDTFQINGIPIQYTSKMPWSYQGLGRRSSDGNRSSPVPTEQRVFSYRGPVSKRERPSSAWNYVPGKVPDKDDVYVILEHFETSFDLNAVYDDHKRIVEGFGLKFPTLYGYRDSKKSPVDKSSLAGTEYNTWFRNTVRELAEKNEEMVEQFRMYRIYISEVRCWGSDKKGMLVGLRDRLGRDHILYKYLAAVVRSHYKCPQGGHSDLIRWDRFLDILGTLDISTGCGLIDQVNKLYPLLKYTDMHHYLCLRDYMKDGQISKHMSEELQEADAYLRYVKDTDLANELNSKKEGN